MGEQNVLDEDGNRLVFHELLKLCRRFLTSVGAQASIQEKQRNMEGIHLRCGEVEPPAHLLKLYIFQSLEVLGVAEQEPGLRGGAPDDPRTATGVERRQSLGVSEERHSRLTRNDGVHLPSHRDSSRDNPTPSKRSRIALRAARCPFLGFVSKIRSTVCSDIGPQI